LFAAIFDISRVFQFCWRYAFVAHKYKRRMNMSGFFDFSLQGVNDKSGNTSICWIAFGIWCDRGTALIAFGFLSWAIRSILAQVVTEFSLRLSSRIAGFSLILNALEFCA
jgi:hypothetical protein